VRPEEKVGGCPTAAQTARKLVDFRDWPPQGESLAGASQNLKPNNLGLKRKLKETAKQRPAPERTGGALAICHGFVTSAA